MYVRVYAEYVQAALAWGRVATVGRRAGLLECNGGGVCMYAKGRYFIVGRGRRSVEAVHRH